MTPLEILSEIRKLPLTDVREIAERLTSYLREQSVLSTEQAESKEDEFERYLLAKGVISQIPTRDETDADFEAFEPIEVKGEPLSETIMRERR